MASTGISGSHAALLDLDGLAPIAAPAAALVMIAALWINRNVVGFLPDDRPGGRKQHAAPTSQAGVVLGLAAIVTLVVFARYWTAGAVAACALIGFLDDRAKEHGDGASWTAKLAVLSVAAVLATIPLADLVADPWSLIAIAATIFVVTNAVNFLDNTDGVAIAVGGLGLLLATDAQDPNAWIAWMFLGVLPLNWPRPRLFLGDAGALSLGLLLGAHAAARYAENPGALPLAVAPIAVPVLDFVQVLTARIVIGHPPWVGDRRHLTHIAIHNLRIPPVAIAPLFAGFVVLAFVLATR